MHTNLNSVYRKITLLFMLLAFFAFGKAQFLMDMVDTTTETGRGMLSIYKKFDHLRFGGYIQPQFQLASEKGARSFEGGDFGSRVSNRFMLRRSRVRIDYVHFEKDTKPGVQFVFQFDANERGFTLRDIWGRIFENRFKLFSFTMGMFARPFGYETNLSSADRESPERGRMNQLLMRSERDLGAMLSFEVRKDEHPLKRLKVDLGMFNGQGIRAEGEFDNCKDLVARISVKPYKITPKLSVSAGISLLYGGLENNTRYHYKTGLVNGIKNVLIDSAAINEGKVSPRRYHGADLQLKLKNRNGFTEIRGEWISGIQTGTANSSETPPALLTGADGFHERKFNGAYFYFLQHLFSVKHQLVIKYDWYDPDRLVRGREIGNPGTGFTTANLKYSTLGAGYIYYMTENVKWVFYFDKVINERTLLPGFTGDVSDDVFTFRLQFRF
jgi:hypothetical protein